MTPALSDIGQIAVYVSDVAKVLPYYRDVLGIPFLFSAGPNLAFLQAGSVRLMLGPPEGPHGQAGANSVLYFRVTDVEASQKAIVSRGGINDTDPHLIAKMPDHELWIGFIRDPDGNLIGLMEEKR